MAVEATMVKSADRALQLLEVFSSDPRPRTFAQLVEETGIPKSSLHALLGTLVHREWLLASSSGSEYSLGSRAVEIGAAFLRTPGRDSYDYVLSGLCARLGETANLGRLAGGSVLYLAVRRPPHAFQFLSSPGMRLPAHATALGKVLLAELEPTQVREHLSFPLPGLTASTITSEVSLMEQLREIRAQGFAREWEETSMGASCTAVSAEVAGETIAIGIAVPTERMTPDKQEEVVSELFKAKALLVDSSTLRA